MTAEEPTEPPLSEEELAAIQARCLAASPAPWKSCIEGRDHTSGSNFIMTGEGEARGEDIELSGATLADQDFIAHARQDIPRLLAEIERLTISTAAAKLPEYSPHSDQLEMPETREQAVSGGPLLTDKKIEGVARLDRVLEVFEVWPRNDLPFAKFKVKIMQGRSGEGLTGCPNVAIKNPETRAPDWIGGCGTTVEETLEDTIRYFYLQIESRGYDRPLEEDDFEWSHPDDF